MDDKWNKIFGPDHNYMRDGKKKMKDNLSDNKNNEKEIEDNAYTTNTEV